MLKTSKYKFIGYWDADLATPLAKIPVFHRKGTKYQIIKCSLRIKNIRLGSSIRCSVFRHYLGRVFATILSNILNIPVYETQCGAKLFRTEYAELIFSKPFLSHWFLGLELFSRSFKHIGR